MRNFILKRWHSNVKEYGLISLPLFWPHLQFSQMSIWYSISTREHDSPYVFAFSFDLSWIQGGIEYSYFCWFIYDFKCIFIRYIEMREIFEMQDYEKIDWNSLQFYILSVLEQKWLMYSFLQSLVCREYSLLF